MADLITYPLQGITYDADDAAGYFATRQSGVYSAEEDFAVTPADGLTVTVSAGHAWFHPSRWVGYSCIMEQPTTLTLTAPDAVRSRIDRIVLRYDAASRKTTLLVLEGTPDSAGPVAPAITRTELIYDLCLAEIKRPAGSTEITTADIYDTRADETVCGVMRDGVTGIPAAQLIQMLRQKIAEVDGGSFYTKDAVDTMLAEIQATVNAQLKEAGTSGQPIVVWSYCAGWDGMKLYTVSIPDTVDFLVVKTSMNVLGPQTVIPRGKDGAIGNFTFTFKKNGELDLYYNSGGYTNPLYLIGYHYLTADDGVKVPYIVDTKKVNASPYAGITTTFAVDSTVDYLTAEWTTSERVDPGSGSSVTVTNKYSGIVARESISDSWDRFLDDGTVKISSKSGTCYVTMYRYMTPSELAETN